MDGATFLDSSQFFRMMKRMSAVPMEVPFAVLSWKPIVSLVLFVHRVRGLNPGLYVLVRSEEHQPELRSLMREDFRWERVDESPKEVSLYLLAAGDCGDQARLISCYQDIAADGAFSLGMLVQFEPLLRQKGPWFYRCLYWETGLVGQLLYLEAEVAGMSGTGIGCFHDNVMHEILGIRDLSWQTLYHFTVGQAVTDPRLQTSPAYEHLDVGTR
jgi:nitroreductase